MTWADNILTEGSGDLEFRLWIEGIDYGFVTARTYGDNQTLTRDADPTITNYEGWHLGLLRDGIKFRDEVDIVNCKLKGSSMTLQIADIDEIATQAFAWEPDGVCYLQSDITTATTSLTVTDTQLFAVDDLIYLDGETMHITALTSSTLTVERGWRGSQTQYHYIEDGEKLRTPEITNRPRFIEGRRCRIYVYSPGDASGGTAIFYGVVSGEPRLTDLGHWEISIDSSSRVLDQQLGAELQTELSIRGAYYPWNAPFVIVAAERNGGQSFDDILSSEVFVAAVGFFENNADFASEVNSNIALETSSFEGEVFCQESEDGSIKFFLRTGANGRYVSVGAASYHGVMLAGPGLWRNSETGDIDLDLSANTLYQTETFPCPLPRSYVGEFEFDFGFDSVDLASPDTNPWNRIYIGGDYLPNSLNRIIGIKTSDSSSVDYVSITDTDATLSSVDFEPSSLEPEPKGFALYGDTKLQLIIDYLGEYYGDGRLNTGSVADFLAAIKDMSAEFCNLGYVPRITSGDIDESTSYTYVNRAAAGRPFYRDRVYQTTKSARLGELLAEECKILGCYLAVNSAGQIYIRQFQAPGTEVPVAAIDASNTIVSDGPPTIERNANGIFNSFVVKNGYDFISNEYTGSELLIRDMTALNRSQLMRTIKAEPKSAPYVYSGDADVAENILTSVQPFFGLFARPYSIVKVRVPLTLFGVYIGDVVTVESSLLPDYKTGTRGWATPVRGLVMGREWDMYQGIGTLSILLSGMPYAGYAPSVYVSAYTGVPPLATTSISASNSLPSPYDTTTFLPTGTTLSDFLQVDMKVLLYKLNSSSGTVENGHITSISNLTVGITIDSGTWTPGSDDWMMTFEGAQEDITEAQLGYCYVANSDRIIEIASANIAYTALTARKFS